MTHCLEEPQTNHRVAQAPLRILIADDEVAIVKFVSAHLRACGFQVVGATDGLEAATIIGAHRLDLAILDVLMPGLSGLEVCRMLREHSNIPVIMLSAVDDPATKIDCLNQGADDYITKPFVPEELTARVNSVLRRAHRVETARSSVTVGPIRIDFDRRQVSVSGQQVRLTPTEYALLEEMVSQAGKVLTHRHLLTKVWGSEYADSREYLHVVINKLRAKIERDPTNPRLIVNIPKVGYVLRSSPGAG